MVIVVCSIRVVVRSLNRQVRFLVYTVLGDCTYPYNNPFCELAS